MKVTLVNKPDVMPVVAGYRKCWRTEERSDSVDGVLGDNDKKLIIRVSQTMDPAHESPLEHMSMTWDIEGVSRALSHQLVRHRIASYSQESQRYVKQDQFGFVTPPSAGGSQDLAQEFFQAMEDAQKHYEELVKLGMTKEDARFVLPNACHTSLVVTMNARAFRNFLKLRLDTHAQWEIRALARAMFDILPEDIKFLFEDIVNDNTKQA